MRRPGPSICTICAKGRGRAGAGNASRAYLTYSKSIDCGTVRGAEGAGDPATGDRRCGVHDEKQNAFSYLAVRV